MAIKDAGMYFIHFLLTVYFLALNILSPPAGNAASACSKVENGHDGPACDLGLT